MKIVYLIVVAAVGLSSCSVYRQGQTPDDVYYSPARENRGAIAGGNSRNNDYYDANSGRSDGKRYDEGTYNGYDDFATADDRWLMMRVRNRYRWSAFDDYYYNPYSFYSPYSAFNYGWGGFRPGIGGFHPGYGGFSPGWSFGLGFGSFYDPWSFGYSPFYNNYWNWNSYYNPYYPGVVIVNPKVNPAGYTRARSLNLNSYNTNYNNRTGEIRPRYNNNNLQYNNNSNRTRYNNSNSTLEGSGRRYSNSNRNNSYYSPSQDRPVRTYSPSSNNNSYSPRSSSGGNSGSSGGGGGSRPARR